MSERAEQFRYVGFELSAEGLLTCRYDLDGIPFEERVDVGVTGGLYDSDAARAAARLVWLLAGVSYYKAGAARHVAVSGAMSAEEASFLRAFYVQGLAEFAHVTGVDVDDVTVGPVPYSPHADLVGPVAADTDPAKALVPFGGGIDSIVVVDAMTRAAAASGGDVALFVATTSDVPFAPIEDTAAVTGLPVTRARRWLDPKILESRERGWLNGHVPVTGVLSAIAVLVAVGHGRGQVVMSNEHSASEPTGLVANGVAVNHQWSKSLDFETRFRRLLAATVTGVDYYSYLRPFSELWVAERFARLGEYHLAFRSCNKAFYVDPAKRYSQWCGECDKCCFIDLILSPYLPRERLEEVFAGREPLSRLDLEGRFRSLLGEPGRAKPLECVGDEGECRRAVLLTSDREDRAGSPLLASLRDYVTGSGMDTPSVDVLLGLQGEHFLPPSAGALR